MQYSEEQIIEWLKSDDQVNRGLKELMNTYQERLYYHVHRIVSTHDDTDDVLQNVFIKVYRNIHRFKGNSSLYTWLYRIATNEALTIAQRSKARSTKSIDDEELNLKNQIASDDSVDGHQASQILQKAMTTLPDKQKLVFQMRYYDEMSYKDISEVLETSVGGLKASYHHAVKKIEHYITSINLGYE